MARRADTLIHQFQRGIPIQLLLDLQAQFLVGKHQQTHGLGQMRGCEGAQDLFLNLEHL
jgi:hypothetical protein